VPAEGGGPAERGDVGRVLGPGAAAALVPGAVDERVERGARPNVEGADALGRVELVAGDGQQVDAEAASSTGGAAARERAPGAEGVVDAGRDLADRLGGVGVERQAARAADAGDLGDRLEGADLV